jgi:hypothetical protein
MLFSVFCEITHPSSPLISQVESFLQSNFGNPASANRFDEPLNGFYGDEIEEFERFSRQGPSSSSRTRGAPPAMALAEGVPPEMLKDYIRSWIGASRSGDGSFRTPSIQELAGFSEMDKLKIGKRSQVLAQQMFSDRAQQHIDSQVGGRSLLIGGMCCFCLPSFFFFF